MVQFRGSPALPGSFAGGFAVWPGRSPGEVRRAIRQQANPIPARKFASFCIESASAANWADPGTRYLRLRPTDLSHPVAAFWRKRFDTSSSTAGLRRADASKHAEKRQSRRDHMRFFSFYLGTSRRENQETLDIRRFCARAPCRSPMGHPLGSGKARPSGVAIRTPILQPSLVTSLIIISLFPWRSFRGTVCSQATPRGMRISRTTAPFKEMFRTPSAPTNKRAS